MGINPHHLLTLLGRLNNWFNVMLIDVIQNQMQNFIMTQNV